jgi:hypothetical protein
VDDPLAITDADLAARIAAGDIDVPMAELYQWYKPGFTSVACRT